MADGACTGTDEEELESEGGGADCAGAGGTGSPLERCADDGSLSA